MKYIVILFLFSTTGCALKSDLDKANNQLSYVRSDLYSTREQLNKTKKELSSNQDFIRDLQSERQLERERLSRQINGCRAELSKPKKSCKGGICFKYD